MKVCVSGKGKKEERGRGKSERRGRYLVLHERENDENGERRRRVKK